MARNTGRRNLIPRIFHRIWLGREPLPKRFQEFGETWKRHHAAWQTLQWSDANLPAMQNSWAYGQAETHAAKSNIARYEILLKQGGVYVDTDFECLQSLEPLLKNVQCFVAWERDNVANNAIIGAIPGHPFVRDLVESLEDNVRAMPDADPAIVQSGPYYLTKVLERHPEVTIFPAALFYPYQWHERWRRNESFPDAYAVHHWTLSSRGAQLPKPRQFGNGVNPCVSVVLKSVADDGGLRLRWVLEGLCVQSVSDFEVIVVDDPRMPYVEEMVHQFKARLDIVYRNGKGGSRSAASPVKIWNRGLKLARSPRLLFLDGDCLPDTDLIEAHARFGASAFVPFAFRRIYPADKLYSCEKPLDYQGLEWHALPDPRRSYPYPPFHGDWRDVEGFCLSAPAELLGKLKGFGESFSSEEGVKNFARAITEAKARLIPMWNQGYVTQLGPAGSEGARRVDPMREAALFEMQALSSSSSSAIPATIEIVLDTSNKHFVDETSPKAKFVRFGLWDNAYNVAGDIVNDVAEAKNFIGADTRRFYFRVRDSFASGTHVNIKWRTLKADGKTDDDRPVSEILTLLATHAGSKVFVSKAIMLVTDDTDRAQPTDSGLAPPLPDVGSRGADQSNHRSRRAKLDGFVKGEYSPVSGAPVVSAQVSCFDRTPDERKRVSVRVINYGSHATIPYIDGQFAHANLRWNQIGIQIDALASVKRPVPPAALNGMGQYAGQLDNPQEQAALNDLIPITTDDTVTAVFVPLAGSNAYSTIARRTKVVLGKRYVVFIDTSLNLTDETLAHEFSHVLFNRFDAVTDRQFFTLNTNPPGSFGIPLPDVRIYRRIQNLNSPDPNNDPTNSNTINWTRRVRTGRFPIGTPDLSAATATTGNTLLKKF